VDNLLTKNVSNNSQVKITILPKHRAEELLCLLHVKNFIIGTKPFVPSLVPPHILLPQNRWNSASWSNHLFLLPPPFEIPHKNTLPTILFPLLLRPQLHPRRRCSTATASTTVRRRATRKRILQQPLSQDLRSPLGITPCNIIRYGSFPYGRQRESVHQCLQNRFLCLLFFFLHNPFCSFSLLNLLLGLRSLLLPRVLHIRTGRNGSRVCRRNGVSDENGVEDWLGGWKERFWRGNGWWV